MKLIYFTDTDTLYIGLREGPAAETDDLTEGVLVDYTADRSIVGITIDGASQRIDLETVEIAELPAVLVRARASAPVPTA